MAAAAQSITHKQVNALPLPKHFAIQPGLDGAPDRLVTYGEDKILKILDLSGRELASKKLEVEATQILANNHLIVVVSEAGVSAYGKALNVKWTVEGVVSQIFSAQSRTAVVLQEHPKQAEVFGLDSGWSKVVRTNREILGVAVSDDWVSVLQRGDHRAMIFKLFDNASLSAEGSPYVNDDTKTYWKARFQESEGYRAMSPLGGGFVLFHRGNRVYALAKSCLDEQNRRAARGEASVPEYSFDSSKDGAKGDVLGFTVCGERFALQTHSGLTICRLNPKLATGTIPLVGVQSYALGSKSVAVAKGGELLIFQEGAVEITI